MPSQFRPLYGATFDWSREKLPVINTGDQSSYFGKVTIRKDKFGGGVCLAFLKLLGGYAEHATAFGPYRQRNVRQQELAKFDDS
jgi:hypothetical protein